MSDSESTLAAICKDYFIGLQWIVDYYTGQKPVNMKWYFSRYIPPLWSDLYDYAQRNSIQVEAIEDTSGPIQPQEQLAMVLPMESWHLIEDKRLRLAPSRIYGYWPVSFGFFSAGRSWLWECEPLIPILSVVMLRHNNGITNAILL
jgi:5'-3' exonuclease